MKPLLSLALAASCFVLACQPETSGRAEDGAEAQPPGETNPVPPPKLPAPPIPAPAPEVVSALQTQAFGKKLLGRTAVLVGDRFVKADLRSAPEFYLIHWSASW